MACTTEMEDVGFGLDSSWADLTDTGIKHSKEAVALHYVMSIEPAPEHGTGY